MWWKYVGCLLRDVGEKNPCGGMKYQTDLGSFRIITSPHFCGSTKSHTYPSRLKIIFLLGFRAKIKELSFP